MRIERTGLIRRLLPMVLVMAMVLISLPPVAFAASLSAIVTSDSMAVYSDVYLTKKIATLSKGTVVVVTASKSGVCAITYKLTGKSGYCEASRLGKVTDYSEPVKVSSSGAKAYVEPNTSSKSVTLKKGMTVNYFGSENGWAVIEGAGYLAYTKEENLALPGQTVATPTPTAKPEEEATEANFYARVTADMYAYKDAAGKTRLGKLKKGVEVYVHRYTDSWALVSIDGSYGYCNVKKLQRVAASTVTPAPTNTLNPEENATEANFYARVTQAMYAYADAAGKTRIGILPKGTQVYVHRYTKSWALVSIDGSYGYCNVAKLKRVEEATATPAPTATIRPEEGATEANFYAQVTQAMYAYADALGSTRIGTLKKGAKVYVHQYTNTWALVSVDGSYGYCNVKKLQRVAEATATPEIPSATIPVPSDGEAVTATFSAVTNENTVVYKNASASSSKLGTLPTGTEVTVLLYNANWAYIAVAGKYGYCARKSLAPTEEITAKPTATPTATAETPTEANYSAQVTADMYTYSDQHGKNRIGALSKGTVVYVHQFTSSWAYVSLDGKYGYCNPQKLQRVEAQPSPTVSVSPGDFIPATVTAANGLDVYVGTSTSTAKKYTLPYGTEVNIVQANSTWAMIELNGNYGFCKLSGLTKNSDLTPSVVKGYATVVSPSAPVYASESTSAVSTTIALGTEVAVYAAGTTWAYVGKGDARGYMLVKHLSSDAYPELSSGDSGTSVLNLQKLLEAYGYFDGVPAGNYSSLTETAVKRFQAAVSGLAETGKADVNTIRVLMSGNAPASPLLSLTLTGGNTGSNVQRLQTRLYYKGYLSKAGSVDGEYGSITTSAIKLFQTAAGLTASGVADSKTLKALYSNSAPKFTGTTPDSANDGNDDPGDVGSNLDKLPSNPTRAEKIEYVVYVAQQQLGKPYVYGATGTSSFDCSGFTRYCFGKVGVSLAHSAQNQGYNAGSKVEGISNLRRGDIVSLNTISDNDLSDHVGIYLGSGKFIHASSGAGKIIISDITSGYYNRVFSWGRRVL